MYGRAKGITAHYWPRPVISLHVLPQFANKAHQDDVSGAPPFTWQAWEAALISIWKSVRKKRDFGVSRIMSFSDVLSQEYALIK